MAGTGITAEMIPHTQFHKGIWLQSTEHPGWYYFKEKNNQNLLQNKRFMSSVDGPLKPLVSFLHKKNIKTTPSCAGHHIGERHLEKIFDGIEKDRHKICSSGLNFKDIESGKIYFFRNSDYFLPWNKNEFVQKLSVYQQRGVIGIRTGNRKTAKEALLNMSINGVSTFAEDSIVFILTDDSQRGDNRSTWNQVTKEVKRILT